MVLRERLVTAARSFWRLLGSYAVDYGHSLSVSQEIVLRLVMGNSAFALTIAAELILGRYGFGRTLSQMLAAFGTAEGALGFARTDCLCNISVVATTRVVRTLRSIASTFDRTLSR
jgi:hypothetical protein